MDSKFLTLFVFAFLASQVNSAAVNYEEGPVETVDFGTALKNFYLAFQRVMPCGYPALGLPPLAPFTLEEYSFNFTSAYYQTSGSVSNLRINGLNNFQILGSSFDAATNRTTFDVIFPEIQLLGEYKLDSMAYIAGFPVMTGGEGLLNLKVVDYRLVGGFTMSPNGQGVNMNDFHLQFHIADALFNNWNNLWDISGNNFANRWAREFVLMVTQEIQPHVDQLYAQLWLPVVNGMLENVSMTDIINFLVQQARELNEVDCTL